MNRARRARRSARGFTLVELMVALSGGLFLSMMVFALARDTSRFYQRENRLAGATIAGLMGFERLKADIARAGYLTTPNIAKDPTRCMIPEAGWPTQLRSLGSLRINPDSPNLGSNTAIAGAGLSPDEIVLAGSYSVSEAFPMRAPIGTNALVLQVNSGPMARLGYLAPGLTATEQAALLANVFKPGRVVRISDDAGLQYFGVIASVAGGSNPQVNLTGTPPLQLSGGGQSCGLDNCTGCLVSVVNFVRYQIRDLRADGYSRFAPLWDRSAGAPGEATRTELVRQELDANGQVIEAAGDLTTELVAEYAVDLGFSVTAQMPGANDAVAVQPGTANFTTLFAPTATNVGDPQRIRAVRVRLSVRSREADREAAIPGGLYRFKLPDGDWARVRTFQADVALHNHAEVRW